MLNRRVSSVEWSGTAEHTVNLAALCLARDGVVKLENLFEPRLIDEWRAHFERFVLKQVASERFPYRVWPLGHQRTHYILEIQHALNRPGFYAAPAVYALAERMLDSGFILVSAAVAYAEPGITPQYLHRDQPLLFAGHQISEAIPAVSLTVAIPLVDTNDLVGGTEFVIGSHRREIADINLAATGTFKGDCLVWDSRLLHRGRVNRGTTPRPLVLLYYQRPWFFNFLNYSTDAEIKITDAALAKVPNEYRHLFEWVRKIWPAPLFSSEQNGGCSCGSGLRFESCHGSSEI